ncbi:hypothetical protein QWY79_15155 [Halomonas sabkhae]|uniref:hypothetical protein n=1 Tax=Halomonas sabkhae TaxID=626223 RepID=UPI0025B4154C|nr:hypothetical protein [Halomonas sabkhae]MDN3526608.1 hypothetical protein [Halomonas sabkhae]
MKVNDYDVIVHFGAPKTGTTAIQKFCLENRQTLKKHGVYYPEHPLDSNKVSAGHVGFSKRILDGEEDEAIKFLEKFVALAKKEKCTLLLSSEALYGKAEVARRCLKGYKVGVLGWFREPVDFFVSNYMQGVKRHGQTRKLTDFCLNFVEGSHPYLDGSFLHDWADQFDDENCDIKFYDRSALPDFPLEYQLLSSLGIDSSKWSAFNKEEGFVNRSYVSSALELKRLINNVVGDSHASLNKEVDVLLQEYSDQTNEPHWQARNELDDELSTKLFQKFEKTNLKLKNRFSSLASLGSRDLSVNQDSDALPEPISLAEPLKHIRSKSPDSYRLLFECVKEKISEGGRGYPLLKLADLMGASFSEPAYPASLLSSRAYTVLSNEKSREADYLREFALTLETLGYYQDALQVIDTASSLRPKGKGILKIRNRLCSRIDRVADESNKVDG